MKRRIHLEAVATKSLVLYRVIMKTMAVVIMAPAWEPVAFRRPECKIVQRVH